MRQFQREAHFWRVFFSSFFSKNKKEDVNVDIMMDDTGADPG